MRKIPVYPHPAAGWSALVASSRKLMDYQSFLRGSVSVLHSNQPHGGFDCPGCAWPDHKTHKTLDVCETGIKVLASETTTRAADAKFFYQNKVSQLQRWSGYELEHAGRLSEPLCYDEEEDRYLPISWEDAFIKVADELKKLASPDDALFYTSGRVTNEPAFLYQLMVRCFGTNNLPDCSNMCHEPTSVMLARQLGVGKATVILEDFERAKLILMFGQNPATNHPRMLEMLAHAHKEGCKIIAINPMREQGLKAFRNPQKPTHMAAGMSDDMVDNVIQIRVGGDVALLTGLAKWLVDNDKINRDFIDTETSGFDALNDWLSAQSWEDIERGSGLTKADIIAVAKLVADSPATICTWGMGITQHVQGDDNVAMITNLLLLLGMIGIEGAGAAPIRGHSNVQGDRTMGIHERPKPKLLASLERVFKLPMPKEDGLDVIQGAKALIDGKIHAFISLGGNYSVAAPDSKAIQHALSKAQLSVFVGTKLNETMLYPAKTSLILPCLSRTERYVTEYGEQFATIEDSICQIVATKGHLKPLSAQLKSEAQIIAGIALALFDDAKIDDAKKSSIASIDWQKMSTDFDFTRNYIAQAIEGFENFNAKIREHKRGFHLYHPARHRSWQTQSGKAQFELPTHSVTLVADRAAKIEQDANHDSVWQLTSVRSHDQFNTMIFGFEDRYRQTQRRDVLFMHPDEMARAGLHEGARVMVTRKDSQGNARTLGPLILTKMDIAAGSVATYYPECNDLIDLDSHAPESRTPAYKSMTVSISRYDEQGVTA
ncbi:FdhF/YdeP family oxidoreductase [Psychrobacter ciconiae]|uniref:FdhF/YdeP family oxidoreductase n=1 Tax=Psychrobacter ciconiae TaxID=1553449 RepID=UPI00191B6CF8|nr:FdhF/YdeP family oxidoreductase [Psychrobacter ciconiae]